MTFADLNLPYSYGHGVWTRPEPVIADDWAAAESSLAAQAQDWIDANPGKASGYHVFRNEAAKTLMLDLMRGA